MLDSAKLTKALDSDPDAVAHLFGSEDGVAARLYAQVDARLASNSDLDSRNTTLKRQMDDISRDKEALALRMEQIEARYRKQFTALDSLLSQLQTTSSYLAQQLASRAESRVVRVRLKPDPQGRAGSSLRVMRR